jgi:ribosome-associated protein
LTSEALAHQIADAMAEKQAEDILLLNLEELSTIADYFVIATGTVDVHIKAIVDHVQQMLREGDEPRKPIHVEGYSNLYWVLMDYGDIVVHVFHPQAREFYKLEKLWGDAPLERYDSTSNYISNS